MPHRSVEALRREWRININCESDLYLKFSPMVYLGTGKDCVGAGLHSHINLECINFFFSERVSLVCSWHPLTQRAARPAWKMFSANISYWQYSSAECWWAGGAGGWSGGGEGGDVSGLHPCKATHEIDIETCWDNDFVEIAAAESRLTEILSEFLLFTLVWPSVTL